MHGEKQTLPDLTNFEKNHEKWEFLSGVDGEITDSRVKKIKKKYDTVLKNSEKKKRITSNQCKHGTLKKGGTFLPKVTMHSENETPI